jgi:hypothetical protein
MFIQIIFSFIHCLITLDLISSVYTKEGQHLQYWSCSIRVICSIPIGYYTPPFLELMEHLYSRCRKQTVSPISKSLLLKTWHVLRSILSITIIQHLYIFCWLHYMKQHDAQGKRGKHTSSVWSASNLHSFHVSSQINHVPITFQSQRQTNGA